MEEFKSPGPKDFFFGARPSNRCFLEVFEHISMRFQVHFQPPLVFGRGLQVYILLRFVLEAYLACD